MCSSTRDYVFDETSVYVTPVDCCVYYPDIDPSFDQDDEITLEYLDVCETVVEAGVTTFAIPTDGTEAKCRQTGKTTKYLDRNGDTVYSETEGGNNEVHNDVCCSLYDASEASTFTLKEACEVRTDDVPDSSVTTFSQSTGKCI